MSGNPVAYRYAEMDLLSQRYHYMYTPYEGPDLLRAFLGHRRTLARELSLLREQALANLSEDAEIAEEIRQTCLEDQASLGDGPLRRRSMSVLPAQPGERDFNTRELLLDLWHICAYDSPSADRMCTPWVRFLLARFEVTKRLYRSYSTDLKPAAKGSKLADNYALLAALLMHQNGLSPDVRYLNAALKLIDLLASVGPSKLGTLARFTTLVAVEAEQTAVQALLDRHKIEL
jgi:hypothetical protein